MTKVDGIFISHLPGVAVAIRNQQFIYHLTSTENIPSIMRTGLLPRSQLKADFTDIADPEIIEGRRGRALEQFVPFHWFAKNPFDGRVHQDRPDEFFVLIAVARNHAHQSNWRVIPKHPLAGAFSNYWTTKQALERLIGT